MSHGLKVKSCWKVRWITEAQVMQKFRINLGLADWMPRTITGGRELYVELRDPPRLRSLLCCGDLCNLSKIQNPIHC